MVIYAYELFAFNEAVQGGDMNIITLICLVLP